jgi:hypothetical protein
VFVKVGTNVAEFEGTVVGTVFGKVAGAVLIVISPKYLHNEMKKFNVPRNLFSTYLAN